MNAYKMMGKLHHMRKRIERERGLLCRESHSGDGTPYPTHLNAIRALRDAERVVAQLLPLSELRIVLAIAKDIATARPNPSDLSPQPSPKTE